MPSGGDSLINIKNILQGIPPLGMCSHNPCNPCNPCNPHIPSLTGKDYKDYGCTCSVEGIPCSIFFMLMKESPPLSMCSHNPCNPCNPWNVFTKVIYFLQKQTHNFKTIFIFLKKKHLFTLEITTFIFTIFKL